MWVAPNRILASLEKWHHQRNLNQCLSYRMEGRGMSQGCRYLLHNREARNRFPSSSHWLDDFIAVREHQRDASKWGEVYLGWQFQEICERRHGSGNLWIPMAHFLVYQKLRSQAVPRTVFHHHSTSSMNFFFWLGESLSSWPLKTAPPSSG